MTQFAASHPSNDQARTESARAIVVHSLDHARIAAATAAELGVPLVLLSAPGAAGSVGIGWFLALRDDIVRRHPGLAVDFVLDCTDEAGSAMAALRRGLRRIRYTGPAATAARLRAMGALLDPGDGPALDLLGCSRPAVSCRNWLAAPAVPR